MVAVRADPGVATERRSADPTDRRPAIVATVLAAALAVGYLVSPLIGQDTSAQLARANFASAHPLTPVDLSWFGGTVQFGYSLWAPWLGGVVGMRLLGAITAVLGAWLATRLLQRARPARPIWGGVAVAICQVADVAEGRITYQCGLVCALAAVLAVLNGRRVAAVPLAFLAGAASPVVTLGLGIVAATAALRRRFGDAVVLAGAGGLGSAIVAIVFADGAAMTFAPESAIRAVLATVLVIALVPRRLGVVRIGAALNLAVIIAAWAVSSPVGSNAQRLSLLFAIPIIAAVVEWPGWLAAGAVVVAVLAQPPVMPDIARLAGAPVTHESYYQPVLRAIDRQGTLTGRVEVPEINGHWDAALLAKHVPLARGWLRQVDTELNNDVFFGNGPDEASYRSWLERNAVQYVAVPDAQLTKGGQREKALLDGGLPYLRAVWSDEHWALYAVQNPAPIVGAPARLVSSDAARIVVEAPGGTTALLRMRWFRWTTLGPASSGCIADDHGQVRLHTDPGRGLVRYVISSSADPFKSAAARGHCP
ncbi:MAG TPA: hypothetical protein VGL39_25440 [Jatrophihabitantaceae bacterium]